MSNQAGYIPLIKTRVLYLGSSVPLETSLGLESVQQPLRDRYGGGGSGGFDVKVTGIDTILTVFSSGILLEYVEDPLASTWFPIQSLHVCCSVRPVRQGYSLSFVPLDSPEADSSREPPLFAAITRRSKGVKVLECHGFVCKTSETALALVQCCTHAFQHKEGWLDEAPPVERMKQTATRIIPAEKILAQRSHPEFKGQPKTYSLDAKQQQQCQSPYEMQTLVVNLPAPTKQPQPPAVQLQPPTVQPASQPAVQPQPAPQPQTQPVPLLPQPPKGYFSNWGDSADQAVMFAPQSPFFPGQSFIIEQEERKKKKKERRRKKDKSDKEVEFLVIKKSGGGSKPRRDDRRDYDYDNDDYDDDYYEDEEDDVAVVYPGGGQSGAGVQGQPMGYVPSYDFGDNQLAGWGGDFDYGQLYYPGFELGGFYSGSDQGFSYPGLDQGFAYPGIDQGFAYPGLDQGLAYPGFDQGPAYPAPNQGMGYPSYLPNYGY